jgi:hypothetical protein
VNDIFDDKAEQTGVKAVPQHEIDAQILREKSARLRELRLAQQASGQGATATPSKRSTTKKTSGKSNNKKSVPLSDWLNTQQKEGRRN